MVPPELDSRIDHMRELRRAARDQESLAEMTKLTSTARAAIAPANYSADQRARLRQLDQQAADAKPQTKAERIRAMYSRLSEAGSIIRREARPIDLPLPGTTGHSDER